MSDRLAFLRAIRANPDDDTARLVFADWLDERGDPLGEFIRVQIELEPVRYRINNPRAVELHRREDELLRAHGDDWITTNGLLTNPDDFGPVFRRGLPDYACLSLDTFLKNGEAIFAAYPTLREVALYGVANRCWELTMSRLLAMLDTLEIADWPTEDDAISLSVSPHLARISRFKLWVGDEMPLLRELVKQADANWPREIELVQLYGGAGSYQPQFVGELNDFADLLTIDANDHAKRDVVRVTRPFEQRFPIGGDLGRCGICAGHLPDGRAAIAAAGFQNWVLVMFTADGSVQQVEVRDSPIPWPDMLDYGRAVSDLAAAIEEWREDELELRPGLIWVREFVVEYFSVTLFASRERERVSTPSPDPPPTWTAQDWRDDCGRVRSWLEHRNFAIMWGGYNYHADWRGTIHTS